MARSMKHLFGTPLEATDGEAGTVQEMLFDDATWKIRYLGVKLGALPDAPEVLIPQERIAGVGEYGFAVYLSADEVNAAPGVDSDLPVSRLHELELQRLYGERTYARYIGDTHFRGDAPSPPPPRQEGMLKSAARTEEKATHDDRAFKTHLRRSSEVLRYNVHTGKGKVGSIDDFLLDPHTWHIDSLTVDTDGLFSHKVATIDTSLVTEICWLDSRVTVALSEDEIRQRAR
ncbi:MAG: hypothetical protein GF331_12090 [Chitinivibrionales bacterium]|nr:hypothetical protein [Chitinivibrionales bacterium]